MPPSGSSAASTPVPTTRVASGSRRPTRWCGRAPFPARDQLRAAGSAQPGRRELPALFPGRGNRVWGARTASSDPEWKYVNVRRYFIYLEASIDKGTQWAVFEPNGRALWANIRETISAFLYNECVSGALLGATPRKAFFVRCDRSTMTQNDLDNGRLICLIGVAALKPAEFVIFRIGQKTADSEELRRSIMPDRTRTVSGVQFRRRTSASRRGLRRVLRRLRPSAPS